MLVALEDRRARNIAEFLADSGRHTELSHYLAGKRGEFREAVASAFLARGLQKPMADAYRAAVAAYSEEGDNQAAARICGLLKSMGFLREMAVENEVNGLSGVIAY